MMQLGVSAERFIHTNVLARQRVSTKHKERSVRSVAFLSIATSLLMLFFFVFLWVRICIIETGYELSAALHEKERLLQQNRSFRIERATLSSPAHIEHIATEKLDMVLPRSTDVVTLKW